MHLRATIGMQVAIAEVEGRACPVVRLHVTPLDSTTASRTIWSALYMMAGRLEALSLDSDPWEVAVRAWTDDCGGDVVFVKESDWTPSEAARARVVMQSAVDYTATRSNPKIGSNVKN